MVVGIVEMVITGFAVTIVVAGVAVVMVMEGAVIDVSGFFLKLLLVAVVVGTEVVESDVVFNNLISSKNKKLK